MNELLPTPRDLPPAGRARIRAELQRVAERGQARSLRFAPILTGVAALAVLGLVVWLAPWQQTAVTTPVATTPTPTAVGTTAVQSPVPTIPGLSTTDTDKIAQGCKDIAHVSGTPRVYNLINDDAGKLALVYTESSILTCTIDYPGMPYNSGFGGLQNHDWLPGDMSADTFTASAGDNGKGKYPAMKGSMTATGRITSKVAKVTYTNDGTTVNANLANGTFVARITRPAVWKDAGRVPGGVVRAYDANGTLIAAYDDKEFPMAKCYTIPGTKDVILMDRDPDLAKCVPATRWR